MFYHTNITRLYSYYFLFRIGSTISGKRISIDNYTAHKGANHKQLYYFG